LDEVVVGRKTCCLRDHTYIKPHITYRRDPRISFRCTLLRYVIGVGEEICFQGPRSSEGADHFQVTDHDRIPFGERASSGRTYSHAYMYIYIYIYSKRTQLCALLLSLKVAGEKTTQLKDVDTHQRKISELLCCNQNQEWSAPHDNHHQTHDALSMYLGRIRAMRPKGIRKLNSLYPPTTDDECKYGENTS